MVTMRFHSIFWPCLLSVLLLIGWRSAAADSLEAQVDRRELALDETLQLQLTGTLEPNFSNFSILNLNLPSPELEPLHQDFEILDQRQRYNFRSINGRNQAEVTWTYRLLPKRSGDLVIPALKFRDAESRPIPIRVLPAASGNTSRAQDLFLEADISKERAHVQEQLIYSLRLYYRNPLLRGELSAPEIPNAIVKPLGKQLEYRKMLDGQEYEVVERRYAIFPQSSGPLEIAPQTFKGVINDPRLRAQRHINQQSPSVRVEVLPPPARAQGRPWLPAMSLSLSENWSQPPEQLQPGDSITRTLQLKALGLEGSQLPPLPNTKLSGIRQYPEPAQIDSESHEDGITGTRIERHVLVADQAGRVQVPEIRIPWWDTVNEEWKEAVLPARTLFVLAPGQTPDQAAPALEDTAGQPGPANAAQDPSSIAATDPAEPQVIQSSFWPLLSLALLIAWLATLGLLLRLRGRLSHAARAASGPAGTPKQDNASREKEAFSLLQDMAGRADWPQMREALLDWAQARWPGAGIGTLAELMDHPPALTLREEILKLEQARYGRPGSSATPNARALVEEVGRLRMDSSRPKSESHRLAELYPSREGAS